MAGSIQFEVQNERGEYVPDQRLTSTRVSEVDGNWLVNEGVRLNRHPDLLVIVEKAGALGNLLSSFSTWFPNAAFLTGCGNFDVQTRLVLTQLRRLVPNLRAVYIGDSNPHGLDIYYTYKYGSRNRFDNTRGGFAATGSDGGIFGTDLHWVGVRPSDVGGSHPKYTFDAASPTDLKMNHKAETARTSIQNVFKEDGVHDQDLLDEFEHLTKIDARSVNIDVLTHADVKQLFVDALREQPEFFSNVRSPLKEE